jgi:putative NADH-flavin reductase
VKLIIFGATGGTGLSLIEQALAAGHEVTAFARSPLQSKARVVQGNVLDQAHVAEAIRGHEVVFSCLGTRPWRHTNICSEGAASITTAMKATGVRRFIAMSTQGIGDSKMSLPGRMGAGLFLRKAFDDKDRMEKQIEATDLDWIVVRPGFMTSGKPRGTQRAADDGSLVGGMICRADVATFMLQQIESTQWLRRRPVVVW